MGTLKTSRTRASVDVFLRKLPEPRRRDCLTVMRIMKRATGAAPAMWGPSIVGFGEIRYQGATGKATEWFQTGFSPRTQALTLYIMSGCERYPELMRALGKHSTGVSCLYVRRLADVDLGVLRELIEESVADITRRTAAG